MLTYLKNKTLAGLALAIASGYVIAHVITETGDYLFINDPELLAEILVAAFVIGVITLAVKHRSAVAQWLASHKRGLAYAGISVFVICAAMAVRVATFHPSQVATGQPLVPAVAMPAAEGAKPYLDANGNPLPPTNSQIEAAANDSAKLAMRRDLQKRLGKPTQ